MRFLLALILGSITLTASAQYRWIDASGRVGYGDSPPRDARDIKRVDARGASGEADTLGGLPFELRRAAQQFPVTLYTTANCAPCDAGRELLRARGVPFSERTVSTREDGEQLEKLALGNRLPILSVGRQTQREFETGAWHSTLDAAGYPRSGQLPRGWQAPPPQPLVAAPPVAPAGVGAAATDKPPPSPTRSN